ncbi:cell wall metabolism sensor histidine kinase WalK [Sporolactobacillus sp. THM19-2]|uniref:sensor histidine kinase n=1 Tax=Sporolactobacillus sp. THM19-2 TaxID=2511171 RepID=UPI0010201358|nr:HAMP domain-containing sensor histidine kinase [Sporolactobacillus sp. THM19-2]RYL88077.1 HAMP domain-containing histidine kinase [Sporolactobacillus sp. THM19-2]
MFKQLQKRLTLTYSLFFFLTLAILFVILYFVFQNMIYQSAEGQIEEMASNQATAFSKGQRINSGQSENSPYLIGLFSESGNDLIDKWKLPDDLQDDFARRIADHKFSGLIKYRSAGNGEDLLIYAIKPVNYNHGSASGYLLVANELKQTHELVESWFHLLVVLGLAAASFSLLIAHFLARRAVRPIQQNYEKQKAFVTNASHELRTPLSVFSASLEYFETEERHRMSESSKETLRDLKSETAEMTMLIRHLLTLAKADQNKLSIIRSDCDVLHIFHAVIPYYRQRALRENKSFTVNLPNHPLIIHANPIEIRQLLTIFLDNAIKYTEAHDELALKSWAEKDGRNFCFEVRDTGIGIAEVDQRHIYDRFYRAEKGRARQSGGSGLGLSIAHELVDAYHGQIRLESKVHEGTVFQVALPILRHRR